MLNQKNCIKSLDHAIKHLKESHTNVAMRILETIREDIFKHLDNSARWELFRTASIDEKSIESTVLESICNDAEHPKTGEDVDALFDRALAALQGFKDAQEALKS